MSAGASLRGLLRDRGGSMTIEMAAVVPVLVLMSIGTFEVSTMVSRQQELQSAASEAETIALAAQQSAATTPLTTVEDIIETSMDLQDDQVVLKRFYRCDDDATLIDGDAVADGSDPCAADAVVTSYVQLHLTDSYTPVWTQFGIGSAFDYDVERMVQL